MTAGHHRTEIVAAARPHPRYHAGRLGLLYLAVGALWWPGLPIAAAALVTARRRARTACDMYALLVEAIAASRRPTSRTVSASNTPPSPRDRHRMTDLLRTAHHTRSDAARAR